MQRKPALASGIGALLLAASAAQANLPPGQMMQGTEQWWYNGRWNSIPPPAAPVYVAPQLTPQQIAQQQAQQDYNAGLAALNQGNWAAAEQQLEQALKLEPDDAGIAAALGRARAGVANEAGIAAFNAGDWRTAVADFQAAARNNPADQTIQANLANAQSRLADAVAADGIRSEIQTFSQTLTAAAPVSLGFDSGGSSGAGSSAGLDFDGGGGSATAKDTGGLAFAPSDDRSPSPSDQAFADASVVDARHVLSGLPKSVEDSIPPTPAGDRVRKGFECISDEGGHDWAAGLAWFKDALLHDPGNAELQRLVDLAQYTLNRRLEENNLPFANGSGPIQSAPSVGQDRRNVNDFIARTHEERDLKLLFQGPPPNPPEPWAKFGQWLNNLLPQQKEAKPVVAGAVRG